MTWAAWAESEAAGIDAIGRWRTIRSLTGGGPAFELDGHRVISFASNDYLGLTQHPAVIAAAHSGLNAVHPDACRLQSRASAIPPPPPSNFSRSDVSACARQRLVLD